MSLYIFRGTSCGRFKKSADSRHRNEHNDCHVTAGHRWQRDAFHRWKRDRVASCRRGRHHYPGCGHIRHDKHLPGPVPDEAAGRTETISAVHGWR